MRPRGKPPTPSAMSSDRAPEGIAETFTAAASSPIFMIDPCPNWRSIWVSALFSAESRAFAAFSVSVSIWVLLAFFEMDRRVRARSDTTPDQNANPPSRRAALWLEDERQPLATRAALAVLRSRNSDETDPEHAQPRRPGTARLRHPSRRRRPPAVRAERPVRLSTARVPVRALHLARDEGPRTARRPARRTAPGPVHRGRRRPARSNSGRVIQRHRRRLRLHRGRNAAPPRHAPLRAHAGGRRARGQLPAPQLRALHPRGRHRAGE